MLNRQFRWKTTEYGYLHYKWLSLSATEVTSIKSGISQSVDSHSLPERNPPKPCVWVSRRDDTKVARKIPPSPEMKHKLPAKNVHLCRSNSAPLPINPKTHPPNKSTDISSTSTTLKPPLRSEMRGFWLQNLGTNGGVYRPLTAPSLELT